MGKINLKESINKFCLNQITKLNLKMMIKINVKSSKTCRSYYNGHISFEFNYESDISDVSINHSSSTLSERDLQWDDKLGYKKINKEFSLKIVENQKLVMPENIENQRK